MTALPATSHCPETSGGILEKIAEDLAEIGGPNDLATVIRRVVRFSPSPESGNYSCSERSSVVAAPKIGTWESPSKRRGRSFFEARPINCGSYDRGFSFTIDDFPRTVAKRRIVISARPVKFLGREKFLMTRRSFIQAAQ
jgi:hypothetical protein